MQALKHFLPSLFRRKVLPTRSLVSTTGICLEDVEGDELSLVGVSEPASCSFGEVLEVVSSASKLSFLSDLITSGEVTGLARRLGDALLLAGLSLDLLIILLVELLRILKFTS